MADGAEGGGCSAGLGLATTALAEEAEERKEEENDGDDDGGDDDVAYPVVVAVDGKEGRSALGSRERLRRREEEESRRGLDHHPQALHRLVARPRKATHPLEDAVAEGEGSPEEVETGLDALVELLADVEATLELAVLFVAVALEMLACRLEMTEAASVKAPCTEDKRPGVAALRIDARLAIRDAADLLADAAEDDETDARDEAAAAEERDELEEARARERDAEDWAGLREAVETAALGRTRGVWRKVREVVVADATAKTRGRVRGAARSSRSCTVS